MTEPHAKADLRLYLQDARDALLWKLDGLADYDVRRPMTPTGTNLLGRIKHVASDEFGHFAGTFGQPSGEPRRGSEHGPRAMTHICATPEVTPDQVLGL